MIVYQLLAHGRWFSPGTPASSTTKAGRHDIAESGIKHHKSNQIMIMIIAMFNGSEDQETCPEKTIIF